MTRGWHDRAVWAAILALAATAIVAATAAIRRPAADGLAAWRADPASTLPVRPGEYRGPTAEEMVKLSGQEPSDVFD